MLIQSRALALEQRIDDIIISSGFASENSDLLPAIKAKYHHFFTSKFLIYSPSQYPAVHKAALATIISCGVEESLSTLLMQEYLQKISRKSSVKKQHWCMMLINIIYSDRSGNNMLFTMPNFANLLYSLVELPGL